MLALAPALPSNRLCPREQGQVDLVRPVLAFTTRTNLHDARPRLRGARAGRFQVAVLKVDSVPAERREEWVVAMVRSALTIEGESPEDRLAALEDNGQNGLLAQVRRPTQESAAEAQSLKALFAQAREHETEAADYLVEGEWELPPAETTQPPSPTWRVVTLEELAHLVRWPKPRRWPAPEGQLTLFAA